MSGKLLIVGCGDIGANTGRMLIRQGWQVCGLRRQGSAVPRPLQALEGDVTRPASLDVLAGLEFSHVLVTLTPGDFTAQAYRAVYCEGLANVLERLGAHPPARIVFASSTSVYHQNDGSWVDEASPTLPRSFSGQVMLEAERLLASCGIAATSVRFGGIYGPGRTRLIDRLKRGHIVASDYAAFSNRIHSADCAGALAHLLQADRNGQPLLPCYVAVDGHPAPLREVSEWLARACGLDITAMSEEPAPLRGGNKRCRNGALLASGYRLQYQDYRAGYAELLAGSGPVGA
jgi:nucleoside-diphosphate-sugar epimerase